jgi:hypothetical protein
LKAEYSLVIRNLHLTDFLKLGRLHEANVGLDVLGSLVVSHSLRSAALSQHLPVSVQNFNSNIYIYEEPEGKPCAFVQARTRQRRDEWDILALGTIGKSLASIAEPTATTSTQSEQSETALISPDIDTTNVDHKLNSSHNVVANLDNTNNEVDIAKSNIIVVGEINTTINQSKENAEDEVTSWPTNLEAENGWQKLLEHLIADAGERGVLRIYARLIEDSPEMDLFSQTGFHTFTHENLYRLNYRANLEKPTETKLRPQRSRDLFPIDQLYRIVTPSLVQHAEAPNSSARSWSLSRNYFPRPIKEQGFVLEENDKIVAYLRLFNHRNRHLITLMCLDNQRERLPQLIQYGLSIIKAGEDVQVYCAVREYQAEQGNVLEDFGFEFFGKQAAMVKHIVQYIKNPERALAHIRDHKLELAHSVIKSGLRQAPRSLQHRVKTLRSLQQKEATSKQAKFGS